MDILKQASKIISGERRAAYGPTDESFRRIALVWNGILLPKLKTELAPEEVALMMIGLKVMREANRPKDDNLVDIIGYTLLKQKLHGTHKHSPKRVGGKKVQA